MPFHPVSQRSNLAVWSLLALLLFQCAGWFAVWQVAYRGVRWQMQHTLHADHRPTVGLVLSKPEFERVRIDHKEILYDGLMFDIRGQQWSGDSVRLVLIHDFKEQRLLESLGALLYSGHSPEGPASPLGNWWAKWMGAVFLPPPVLRFVLQPPADPVLVETCLSPAAQGLPQPFSPPPELDKVSQSPHGTATHFPS